MKLTYNDSNKRTNPMGAKNCRARRNQRRNDAVARADLRAARSDNDQLKLIDSRPGKSAKERARLEAKLKKDASSAA